MRRAEIEQAIRDETPLAWSTSGVPREEQWPAHGVKVVPVELLGGGRVRVRRDDNGAERNTYTRDLMEWEKYSEIRARVDAENAERRRKHDELTARLRAAVAAFGGGARVGTGVYEYTTQRGVWLPIDQAEQVLSALTDAKLTPAEIATVTGGVPAGARPDRGVA